MNSQPVAATMGEKLLMASRLGMHQQLLNCVWYSGCPCVCLSFQGWTQLGLGVPSLLSASMGLSLCPSDHTRNARVRPTPAWPAHLCQPSGSSMQRQPQTLGLPYMGQPMIDETGDAWDRHVCSLVTSSASCQHRSHFHLN